MKIGIDISQIVYGTGVSHYTQNLVENLLKIDEKNEYVLFFSSLRQRLTQISNLKTQNCNLKLKTYKFPPVLLDILWNKLHVLPIEKLIGKVDVFHTSDWTEPPSACRKVTTIHDLTPLLFPDETHPKIIAVHKRKLDWVKKEASLVIAVSENTKKDIIELLGIPAEKIRVIYEAPGEEFYPRRKEEIENTKRKYQIAGDYILAMGGGKRKNLERTTQAFERVKGGPWQKVSPSLIVFGNSPNTKSLGYVPQEDLAPLYSGAMCFVYPSLYEGFGLPVLEAMACGCPVVTSNVSSLPEIAGEAAVLVNPLRVEEIFYGINEALERREEFVQKGLERSHKFSWEKCASETLAVYGEVVK
ncbi:glycosyltransferase family 4 protein [Candidatus Shapirobacteria bacterium]|nr:glycosyltransferase family 4 protein [Candidatus Shapirobacteria bacterium]